jgi:hypothetical protein
MDGSRAWRTDNHDRHRQTNARNDRCVTRRQDLVSLWCGAHPLHGEVLECEEEIAQIAPDDFDFVARENDPHRFALIGANEGRGDHLTEGKEMDSTFQCFDSKAGGRRFTMPARWSGWAAGIFEMSFHGEFSCWV